MNSLDEVHEYFKKQIFWHGGKPPVNGQQMQNIENRVCSDSMEATKIEVMKENVRQVFLKQVWSKLVNHLEKNAQFSKRSTFD